MIITKEILNRGIIDVYGNPFPLNFPTQEYIAGLPKIGNGQPDRTKMRGSIVQDIILDCLKYWSSKSRKEGRMINEIAQSIISVEKEDRESVDLKDRYGIFLVEVIENGMLSDEEKVDTRTGQTAKDPQGLHQAYVIDQTLTAIGAELDEKE